jgi:CMP-N,N'-diacetyllegionaminic acid synthase
MKKQSFIINKFGKIPCIILARKGSKALKNKNTFQLNKKPLIVYSIEYAQKCKFVTDIIISTDDPKVYRLAKKYNCFCVYPRPKYLSNDDAKSEPAMVHALKEFEKKNGKTKYYAYLQCTEPLRPKEILNDCFKYILSNEKIDSAFAGYKMHKNIWENRKGKMIRLSKFNQRNLPRQKKNPVFREDTGIALVSKSSILRDQMERIGKKVKIVPYNSLEGLVDIHTIDDIKLAKSILYLNEKK